MTLPFASTAERAFTGLHVAVYRATGGVLGGRWGRARLLLLTTTGRRTGARRTKPLLCLPDPEGDRWVVVADANGSPRHPAWWLNLRQAGTGVVQLGRERHAVTAFEVTDDERAVLWPQLAALYRGYERDARRTTRRLPVVALVRSRKA